MSNHRKMPTLALNRQSHSNTFHLLTIPVSFQFSGAHANERTWRPQIGDSLFRTAQKSCRLLRSELATNLFYQVHKVTFNMASAYRNANRGSDESDSDMSDVDVELNGQSGSETGDSSDEASSEEETAAPTLVQLPIELRNRILMLTSRGVSHR